MMTTMLQQLVTCVLCEQQTQLPVLTSTSSFGPPDLDLRPVEPARSSIFAWVQRCSSCGYCAPSISEATPYTREVVESIAYRALLGHAAVPELARSFLCSSLVFEKRGEEAAASRSAIEAAWACDDEGAVAELPGRASYPHAPRPARAVHRAAHWRQTQPAPRQPTNDDELLKLLTLAAPSID